MPQVVVVLLSQEDGRRLAQDHCRRVGLALDDLERLIEESIVKQAIHRRRALWQAFDEILEEVRTEEAPCSSAR